MNTYPAQIGQSLCAGLGHDVGMGSHVGTMHFAQLNGKRLLHRYHRYALCMSANERLRIARAKFFDSAAAAAKAMGIPAGTYAGHENGHRGFPAKRAPLYARRFKVSEEWLLYGKGERDAPDLLPNEDDLQEMLKIALDAGVSVETRLSDLPRIVAPTLRALLERYVSDRSHPDTGRESGRDKDAQSHVPTN